LNDSLSNAYCGKIGVEFMHMPSRSQCTWIRNKFELKQYNPIENDRKVLLLDRLLWTDEFAQFISAKFNTMKRFGLEGCESFIPGMKAILDKFHEMGGEKVVMGMPHRGRLNVLANVVRKPTEIIFAEFQGVAPTADKDSNWHENSGDVKYHLGTSFTREYDDGTSMTCEILANPSHLECINPVVMGKVRAE
jgi:2-oxoglutarate dehydrogenase E1 component